MILWIEDILRPTTIWPWGMFDLAREPIRQGCGIDMGHPLGSGKCPFAPGFDPDAFRAMVPRPPDDAPWRWSFRNIPETARSYINQAIPSGATVLSFEMPPWLSELCEERGIPYADIRVSPLRFARDLYLAIRTNSPELHRRLFQESVPVEEVRLEAGMLAASIRMHQDCLDEQQRYPVRLDGCLVFVGQAPFDTSLIDEQDRPLRCQNYADRIASLARGRTVLHSRTPWHSGSPTRSVPASPESWAETRRVARTRIRSWRPATTSSSSASRRGCSRRPATSGRSPTRCSGRSCPSRHLPIETRSTPTCSFDSSAFSRPDSGTGFSRPRSLHSHR
ncbi:MAG: hypothetical protein IPI87_12580 [Betaproteobacteria bacterium]|nr:hypothetical protein [Betaproteobacteria bacterium]